MHDDTSQWNLSLILAVAIGSIAITFKVQVRCLTTATVFYHE